MITTTRTVLWFQLALVAICTPHSLLMAETAAEKGLAIARETDRRDHGFQDWFSDAVMTLRNKDGAESVMHFRMKTLEGVNDGNKTIAIIEKPLDMAGTTILTFAHGLQPDDQWLFLPALKRVKRIASVNKSGPFLGSEFAYEDIASWQVEKFTYQFLRDENLNGRDSFVVQNTPAYEYSGYLRQEEWVDKERYQPNRIVFYDRKGDLLKTLTFSKYEQHLDHYWRAREMEMVNHQTGKSTKLEWSPYQFRTGLTDQDFNRNVLERAK